MIPRCWFPGYCDGSRRQYYDWLRRWNNGSSQKLLRVGIPTCIHRWQCNCKEVMSLFVARSGLWLRRNLKFLYSEFGVYCFYRMLKSKKVGTVHACKFECVVAPKMAHIVTTCLQLVACFRHRAEMVQNSNSQDVWSSLVLLIGIQPPHVHGVLRSRAALSATHFRKHRATFSSFRLLAKHRSTCKVSSYQLASNAASIQRLTHIFSFPIAQNNTTIK